MINTITKLITLIAGFAVTLDFFVDVPFINNLASTILSWMPLIASFAVVAGAINVVTVNKRNLQSKKGGMVKINSVVTLVFLALTIGIGLVQGTSSPGYNFLYYEILIVCGNTLGGLLAFFIASSCFRAFRARNLESSLLLIAGALVILGQSTFGALIWSKFPVISDWIMNYPNLGAQRGLLVASAVGFISVCLRAILGQSKSMSS